VFENYIWNLKKHVELYKIQSIKII